MLNMLMSNTHSVLCFKKNVVTAMNSVCHQRLGGGGNGCIGGSGEQGAPADAASTISGGWGGWQTRVGDHPQVLLAVLVPAKGNQGHCWQHLFAGNAPPRVGGARAPVCTP